MKSRHICAGRPPPVTLVHRAVVVIADPDADDEIAGEADEHGVAMILRRARLAEGRRAERGGAAGAAVGGGVEQIEHRRPRAPRPNGRWLDHSRSRQPGSAVGRPRGWTG